MSKFFKKVLQSITVQSIHGFECEKESCFIVGPWKVYKAQHKSRSGSVWICDQKHELVQARKEYTALIRLKYQGILQVLEPLIDEKTYIGFVTERVDSTLEDYLGKGGKFSDIEMKLHILEVVDGLQFLHNNVRQVHLDICASRIYLTENGKWKIGASPYQVQVLNQLVECPAIDYEISKLSYMAKEVLQVKPLCSQSSDMYSLGMVLLRLLKTKEQNIHFPMFMSLDQARMEKNQDWSTNVTIDKSLNSTLQSMLSPDYTKRPSLAQFIQIQWLRDPYLVIFNILNKFSEYDTHKQTIFFKGLTSIIHSMEKGLLENKLLPTILEHSLQEHLLVSIIQIILESLRRDDLHPSYFQQKVWPKQKVILQNKEVPAQVLYDLVLGLPIFYKYLPQREINDHLIPLLIKCYECRIPKLQDLALRVTEFVIEHSDFTFSKTKILPRLFSLCLDQNLDIRKVALITLYKNINILENDSILHTLEKVKSLGTDREVNQIILKIYQLLSRTLSPELIATKLLPQLTPYLTDTTLTKSEFNEFYETLMNILQRIKNEKEKILQDQDKGGILRIDYQLTLPSQSRKGEIETQFDFLNQFETFKQEDENSVQNQSKNEVISQIIPTASKIMTPPVPQQIQGQFGFVQLGMPIQSQQGMTQGIQQGLPIVQQYQQQPQLIQQQQQQQQINKDQLFNNYEFQNQFQPNNQQQFSFNPNPVFNAFPQQQLQFQQSQFQQFPQQSQSTQPQISTQPQQFAQTTQQFQQPFQQSFSSQFSQQLPQQVSQQQTKQSNKAFATFDDLI